jgi:predicted transcriptional regulator
MAQNLIEKHDMNQIEAARILGVTQSAISKYSKKVRGTTIPLENVPQVQTLTDQMIILLMADPVRQTDVMQLFCQTCRLIRSQSLMCPLCQQNQVPKIDGCNFCGQP